MSPMLPIVSFNNRMIKELYRWRLGIIKWYYHALYDGCNYLTMLGLKSSKRDPWCMECTLPWRSTIALLSVLWSWSTSLKYCICDRGWITMVSLLHDDVIKWKHFPRYWQFVREFTGHRSLNVFFDIRLSKRLSKQSWGWWFETSSRPLWRHCKEKKRDLHLREMKASTTDK